jgi:hypothetical protein
MNIPYKAVELTHAMAMHDILPMAYGGICTPFDS